MYRYLAAAALAAVVLPAAPAAARDMQGYTLRATVLLAGPESDYPQVRQLRASLPVTVHGCLDDRSWCDISTRTARGWIDGQDLAISHRGRRSPIGGGMGIGIVSFLFGTYWDDNYRSLPFYAQRSRWAPQGGTADHRPWSDRGHAAAGRAPSGAPGYRPFGAAPGSSAHGIAPPLDRNIPGGQFNGGQFTGGQLTGRQPPRAADRQPLIVPDQPPIRPALPDAHARPAAPVAGPTLGVPSRAVPNRGDKPDKVGTDGHDNPQHHD